MSYGDFSRYVKNERELKIGNLSLILNLVIFSFLALFIVSGVDVFLNQDPQNLDQILTNPTDIIGKLNNMFIIILALIFIIIASASTNLIANFIPSQYTLINLMPSSLSIKGASTIIVVFGFIVGIFWLTILSQIGILSFVDTIGAFFGPLFGIMIADFYFIKKQNLNNKDIYSLEKNGEYYYSGGFHLKGSYSIILGFIFSASTIWNSSLMFLQSYSWIIGAFVAGFVYYLLAKNNLMDKISFDFTNKTAVVTGGAQGFGLDITKRFLRSGAKVIIWDIDVKMLEKAIKDINNPNLSMKKVDVSNFKEVENSTNEILEETNIDILINNAGITGPTASLWEYDVEIWKKVVDINLMGTFNCCRSIVPNMIKNNYGRIVNVASVAGKDGNANASAYSTGKAAAIGLTKSLGKELADKNIAVNAITPAGAKTRILDQMTKEHVQRMLSKVPRGRFLEVEEFTSLVCWLSSEENTFSTAAVFDISGGRSTY